MKTKDLTQINALRQRPFDQYRRQKNKNHRLQRKSINRRRG